MSAPYDVTSNLDVDWNNSEDVVMQDAEDARATFQDSSTADNCVICLERLESNGTGNELVIGFPSCTRHQLHLGCVAQLRVQANSSRSLICPVCRDTPCRVLLV